MRSLVVPFLLVLAACESSSIGNDNPDAPSGGFFDAGAGNFDARVSCTRQTECGGTQICNPSTMRCVPSLSCTGHAQCGGEAYCDNGSCAPNVLRGLCEIDANCVGQERCEAGRCGCGGEMLGTTAVAPNMLIALDRSDSMNQTPGGGGGPSKWQIAISAIKGLTTTYASGINFGLTLWPGTSASCTGAGQVDCQGVRHAVNLGGTAAAIGSALDGAGTCNLMTPIGNTLDILVDFAPLGDTARENYVVLVTDGEENCGGNGPARATELINRNPSVRTFVIGFGGGVDATLLTNIAVNGGTARTGTPRYYQADDADTLIAAFEDITGSIRACEYTLSVEPDSPDRLFVFFGTTQINRDPTRTNGWEYDSTTKRLSFYGTACTMLRGGAGNLVVSLGCPIIP